MAEGREIADDVVVKAAEDYWHTLRRRLTSIDGVSPFSEPARIEEAHGLINTELGILRHLTCFVQRQRNALSPTYKLPVEILARVFHFCVLNESPYTLPETTRLRTAPYSLGWIKLTHVCHRWRTVALENPGFWANLSFGIGPRWFEEMLARAKTRPLVFTRDKRFDSHYPASLLRPCLPRVQHFALSVHPDDLEALMDLLTDPMPLLEYFEILVADYKQWQQIMRLPADLFAGQAPRLRYLNLCGGFEGQLPPLPELVHLELKTLHSTTIGYIFGSFEHLYSSLKNVPNLETLIMERRIAPRETDPAVFAHGPRVSLDRLKKVQIVGVAYECVGVLSQLPSLPLADVAVTCLPVDHPYLSYDQDRFMATLNAYCEEFMGDAHFFSAWASPCSGGIAIKLERCYRPEDPEESSSVSLLPKPSSRLRLHINSMSPTVSYAGSLAYGLTCHHIETLAIGGPHYAKDRWAPSQWFETFGYFVNVQLLCISHAIDVYGLFTALAAPMKGITAGAGMLGGGDLFPRLQSILLCNLDLAHPTNHDGRVRNLSRLIRDSITTRQQSGHPLRSISLKNTTLAKSFLGPLVKLVSVYVVEPDTDDSAEPHFLPGGFPVDYTP
ncbi:hypothetical protein EVG20_g2651 [Dentipellis fragilis]|uniref:Uncharacterized protein n=1 Tax=Dentipellis fragilis TaxID=205917 RepID=A0A4Y9Z942_9AGAM|nr:hypothetical protein EVG20_g2651 [Dentipellis fragilis]